MRLRAFVVLVCVALSLAPAASAQKKQKDPVLQAYLEETFSDLRAKLASLSDRLTVMEEDLARLKQQQTAAAEDTRNSQTMLKTFDASLSSFRLSTQQDIISIKQELAAIRKDLGSVVEASKRPEAQQAALDAPKIEGYITAVTNNEVTINLGSGAGMKVGTKLTVFRATDAKTQIGLIEIVEVLDANNSRAKIVFNKPDAKFEFSDIVRPE
jgi:hypothetical protein